MKRSNGMSLPVAKNMSSISGAKSGSVICDACCIARDVRPILRPLIAAPVRDFQLHPFALDGVAVLDGHAGMLRRKMPQLGAALARLVQSPRQRSDGIGGQHDDVCRGS